VAGTGAGGTGDDAVVAPAATAGLHSLVVVRYVDAARSWLPVRILGPSPPPVPPPGRGGALSISLPASRPATCVAWAPNVGRRFHYVAAAHGNCLVIYRLHRGATGAAPAPSAAANGGAASPPAAHADLHVVSAQVLADIPAWKCQWNVTGTVLASSGDGGSVWMHRIDPSSYPVEDQRFVLVSEIRPPGPPE
jgi:nucleoporin SEH1